MELDEWKAENNWRVAWQKYCFGLATKKDVEMLKKLGKL